MAGKEKKKKQDRDEREREGAVNTHFCQDMPVKKSKETKAADGWRWS